jgi:N-acetylmuramoyl-L-alanine amidase
VTDLSGIAVLKPRVQPHPDRYGGLREWSGPPQGVCWHTTEGGEGLSSAEGLAGMMARSKVDTGGNFAAYHYVVDADSIIPLCLEEQEPYAQGGANDALISVCVTGKAGQTPEQWADEMSHPALLNMALLTARIVLAYNIPVVRLRGPDLVIGSRGICGHVDVRDAYGKTTHTDPGPFFPWPMMLDLVAEIAYPPQPPPYVPTEDDRMAPLYFKSNAGTVWALDPYTGSIRNVSGQEWFDLLNQNPPGGCPTLTADQLAGLGLA